MALNKNIGNLAVKLTADAKQYEATLDQARAKTQTFGTKIKNNFRAISIGIAAVGAAAVAAGSALIDMGEKSIAAADNIGKTAKRIGLTAEEFQAYDFAAAKAGLTTEQFANSYQRLTRRIGELQTTGSGTLKTTFEDLDIAVKNTDGTMRSTTSIFEEFTDKLANTTDFTKQLSYAFKGFDTDGAKMIEMLKNGSAGLNATKKEAYDLGIVLSNDVVASMETAADRMEVLNRQNKIFELNAGVALAPLAIGWRNFKNDIANTTQEFLIFLGVLDRPVKKALKDVNEEIAKVNTRLGHLGTEMSKTESSDRLTFLKKQFKETTASAVELYKTQKELEGKLSPQSDSDSDNTTTPNTTSPTAKPTAKPSDITAEAEAEAEAKKLELKIAAEEVAKALEKDSANNKLDMLRQSFMTEEEALNFSYQNRAEIINNANELKLLTEDEFNNLTLENNASFQDKMTEIHKRGLTERQKFQKKSGKDQTEQVIGDLTNMTRGIASQSKAAFNINKMAGIAQATINTSKGVSESLSAYPMPLAGIMAAAHLAAGVAQVNAIRSTSFSGGGGTSGGISTPSVPTIPTDLVTPVSNNDNGRQIVINIDGNLYHNDDFKQVLVETLEQAQANDEIRIIN